MTEVDAVRKWLDMQKSRGWVQPEFSNGEETYCVLGLLWSEFPTRRVNVFTRIFTRILNKLKGK